MRLITGLLCSLGLKKLVTVRWDWSRDETSHDSSNFSCTFADRHGHWVSGYATTTTTTISYKATMAKEKESLTITSFICMPINTYSVAEVFVN